MHSKITYTKLLKLAINKDKSRPWERKLALWIFYGKNILIYYLYNKQNMNNIWIFHSFYRIDISNKKKLPFLNVRDVLGTKLGTLYIIYMYIKLPHWAGSLLVNSHWIVENELFFLSMSAFLPAVYPFNSN